jgi:small subunit ribosomal protein S21
LTGRAHFDTFRTIFEKGEVIAIAFVKVDDGENLEKAIKRFKRMVEKEGIIREWKKREYYEKPSTIRNRKRKSMERKIQKKIRKAQAAKSY